MNSPTPASAGNAQPKIESLTATPELAVFYQWLAVRLDEQSTCLIAVAEAQLQFERSERTILRWLDRLSSKGFIKSRRIAAGRYSVQTLVASCVSPPVSAFVSAPVPTQTPDRVVAALQKIVEEQKRIAGTIFAPSAPVAIGVAVDVMARELQERSPVPNVPQAQRSNYVPLNVPGSVEKDLGSGTAGESAGDDRRNRFEREARDLERRLGSPEPYRWKLFSFVFALLDGPLSEAQFRGVVESAEKLPPIKRWKYATGALFKQLTECGPERCRAAGVWGDSESKPVLHRFRDLNERMAAMGIPWRPAWTDSAFPAGRTRKPPSTGPPAE
jgi:hypothetical protein